MGSDVLLGVVKAFVNRFENTTNSGSTLTTTSPGTASPSATSNQLSPETSKHPSNLPPPTSKSTSDQEGNKRPGPFTRTHPISPPLVHSTSSGSSVPQIVNNTNQDSSQTTPNPAWSGTSLPSYSAGSWVTRSNLKTQIQTPTRFRALIQTGSLTKIGWGTRWG